MILNTICISELARKFPVHPEVKRRFLTRLILILERQVSEVVEEFYDALMTTEAENAFCYKSYFHPECGSYLLSLSEIKDLVSGGTTGLRTWEAASALALYLIDSEVTRNKSVLELGSGVGYTAITLLKQEAVATVIASDCHGKVLERLEHNCRANLPEDDAKWTIRELDWTTFQESDAQALHCQVVIAADVVFDPTLVPHLARTIKFCLHANAERAIVACTLRNEDTLALFLSHLKESDLKWSQNTVVQDSATVHIYTITK